MQSAEIVIGKFGGQTALARLLGKGQSTVQHWAKSGQIPAKWQSELLRLARERGIDLSPGDFISVRNRHSHSVHFYEEDAFLIEKVARFLAAGLEADNSAIVALTPEHRSALAGCLRKRGFDVEALERDGRFIALDAAETLAKFMVNGRPDASRFEATIGPIIERANAAAGCDDPCAAVFGEMVAVLWKQGNRDAAIQLEELWNDLNKTCSFSLLCGYPMAGFTRENLGLAFSQICSQHSDVIPAESYSALTDASERMRSIARLQQRSQALESEIRRSREQLDLVQSVAGVGSWEITLDDDWIALSRQAREILGLNGLARMPLSQLLELMCLSGDRGEFLAAVKRARTGRKEFNVEFRVKAEGKPRLLLAHGRTFYNSGQPVIVGVLKQQEDSDGVKLRPAPARPGRNSEV